MSDALLTPMAVATGVGMIVVAVAVVLVVLVITVSMRGRQKRGATRRAEDQQGLAEANERAARAERDRDIAQEQAQQPNDRDGGQQSRPAKRSPQLRSELGIIPVVAAEDRSYEGAGVAVGSRTDPFLASEVRAAWPPRCRSNPIAISAGLFGHDDPERHRCSRVIRSGRDDESARRRMRGFRAEQVA